MSPVLSKTPPSRKKSPFSPRWLVPLALFSGAFFGQTLQAQTQAQTTPQPNTVAASAAAPKCTETFSGARVLEIDSRRQMLSERFGEVGAGCLRAAMVDVEWVELNLSRQSGMLWMHVHDNPSAQVRHAQVQVVTQNDSMTLWISQAPNPAALAKASAPTAPDTRMPASSAEVPEVSEALEAPAASQARQYGDNHTPAAEPRMPENSPLPQSESAAEAAQ